MNINTNWLTDAVNRMTGKCIFGEPELGFVVKVDGVMYATYEDLAEAYDLNIEDYTVDDK